jgi:ssDNA-binding Zn-finger/Zn-ribbon topoisomerase 1
MTAYESVKCPDCGGEMISRTGKFGVFWGCKDFPKCKGTRDSEGRSKADREAWKAEQEEKNSPFDVDGLPTRTKGSWNVK